MIDQKLYDRLVARISKDPATGCWNWTGPRRKSTHPGNAYGYISIWNLAKHRAKSMHCHRAIMIAIHGPLTREQCVCHKCDNVLCINPDHLYIGTMKQNIWDSRNRGRHYESRKTTCDRGHPLSGDNLLLRKQGGKKPGPRRICKTCEKAKYRLRMGWPEHLAFDYSIKVPMGYALDFRTGQFVPCKTLRRPDSAKEPT